MFGFSLLTPGDNDHSFKAALLEFDNEFKLIADPSWNGVDVNAAMFMEEHLKETNAILLSHSTAEFISGFILLCIKFPILMSSIPVYSTLPVNQLGRVSTVEYYRAMGFLGPVDSAILELDEVDNWFDKVNLLKYQQSLNLFDNKVVVTPYNAGHSLGGTFWLITKRIDRVIYAPAWNHSKDSFLNSASFISPSTGNPHLSLLRPTAFITATDMGSVMSHRKRTEKFLQLVDATLANGGAAVLPTSLSGRFLELFHLIDEHLKGAPIPVYFLSYSGTKILTYASNLLDWMSKSFTKEWEELSSVPFNPSKVDLLLDPSELLKLSGPKIVFCSGIDLRSGDISAEAFQYLCNDDRTTIILTEKTTMNFASSLSSVLYTEWDSLAKKRGGGESEDGIAVPIDKNISLKNWTKEVELTGTELTEFQEKVAQKRKEKLLAKVRDQKNQNILSADTVDSEDSSDDDDEGDNEAEKQKGNTSSNLLINNTRISMSQILMLLLTKQATFPYFATAHKQKFDDYGEVIKIEDYQRHDEVHTNQNKQQANKLTPQEQVNRKLLQKYLDTLSNPKKRVGLNYGTKKKSETQKLKVRCGLSFVDLSGLVDLRSLGIIVQALKPYNLILLPDYTPSQNLTRVQEFFANQQNEQLQEQTKKNLAQSSRYLSLVSIRDGLSSAMSPYSSGNMNVMVVHDNESVKIGAESESGSIGINNFEVNLDDSIVKDLKWQKIGDDYKVAKLYGELELQNQFPAAKKTRTLQDYINSNTHFSLRKLDGTTAVKRQETIANQVQDPKIRALITNGPKLAIGNIRLPDLKKKLQNLNMTAEFKSEGTLVVNDILAVRKIAYGLVESDESGDIVIDGNVGPLYYKVKECIREMLAYV
ncbi:Cleavage and polyadenylation factor 2 C-terminal family protein [Candida albicans]|uniref:Cleavage and polyadenylation specificity factor subunit 2 n=1 Tax=Candida albicans TaxID=5476 RepID=A0A8H6C5S4_CANAX|nr:Cleavage and polyadenylation factor 2 C-terminal family protein [Candida albicans]